MAENKNAYELERDRRIEENKRKMQELGLEQAAAAIADQSRPVKKQKRAKAAAAVPDELVERRVSARERKAVNYCEMESRTAREPKAPVDYSERIKGMTLDKETAEQLRAEIEAKRTDKKAGGKARGPVDSGKGVRIQGGRVYDSKHGVTCHWCRQKTLEDHVTCNNPCCGNGRRMPLSFCAKCLKNRHGEDYEAADASGSWWCPACRGSCGPGCVTCCNCGPCRKKAGLEPTHQVVKLARDAGFDNVHDYLVHLVTGEDQEVIAERKLQHSWGGWLKADSSDASAQTGACRGGCSSHSHQQQDDWEEQEAKEDSSSGTQEQGGDTAQQDKDQRDTRVTEYFRASKPNSCRNKNKSSSKAAGKAAGKAKAAAAAGDKQQDVDEPADEAAMLNDVPMLSSQDTKLSRKQRIMQSMGLAPVTVCA